jgi:hypothetical protein
MRLSLRFEAVEVLLVLDHPEEVPAVCRMLLDSLGTA